jgi:hypothetical protein
MKVRWNKKETEIVNHAAEEFQSLFPITVEKGIHPIIHQSSCCNIVN